MNRVEEYAANGTGVKVYRGPVLGILVGIVVEDTTVGYMSLEQAQCLHDSLTRMLEVGV